MGRQAELVVALCRRRGHGCKSRRDRRWNPAAPHAPRTSSTSCHRSAGPAVSHSRRPILERWRRGLMNLTLWIVTGFLAAAYLIGGLGKLILSKEKIAAF